mgnify:CR=1 FL=1
MTEAVETYDQVLFDGPPVLLVSDALVLSALMDGVLLVCRARTSRGMIQRAKSQLTLVNARIIGAVLNAVETTRGGYFRKYYREFYDYQERPLEEVPTAEKAVEALPTVRPEPTGAVSEEPKPPEIDTQAPDLSWLRDDQRQDEPSEPKDGEDGFKWPGK